MDKKVYLKTYGLLYLIVAFFALAAVGTVNRAFPLNLFIAIPAALVAGIPITFIVLKILLYKHMKDPYVKLHSEFMQELFTNGYTDKFFELSEKAITAHKNGEKFSEVYLNNFVFYTADYYNLTGQYDKALSLLGILDEKDFTAIDATFADDGMYAVMYFGCVIESYRGLDDKSSAINLIERARPVLDRNFKNDSLSMASDATYYNYYMLIGNFEKASEFVNKLKSYDSDEAGSHYIQYYVEADFDAHLGRKEEALEILNKMNSVPGVSGKPIYSFIYQRYKERLGLTGETAGT